jgi:hypothetical protein
VPTGITATEQLERNPASVLADECELDYAAHLRATQSRDCRARASSIVTSAYVASPSISADTNHTRFVADLTAYAFLSVSGTMRRVAIAFTSGRGTAVHRPAA